MRLNVNTLSIDFKQAEAIRDQIYYALPVDATIGKQITVAFTFTALMLKVSSRYAMTSADNDAFGRVLAAFNGYMTKLSNSGVTQDDFWKNMQDCPAFAIQYFSEQLQVDNLKKIPQVMSHASHSCGCGGRV